MLQGFQMISALASLIAAKDVPDIPDLCLFPKDELRNMPRKYLDSTLGCRSACSF